MSAYKSFRFRFAAIFVLVAILLFGIVSSNAEAAKRRSSHSNRRASAASQAQKQRAIKIIQQQVASAQSVLDNWQSQASMSQTQLSEAMVKLTKIRGDIDNAHDDVKEATKALREIENEIVAEQATDSDYGKAKASFDEAQRAVHLIIHRGAGLPATIGTSETRSGLDELSKLTAEQRKNLEVDPDYQSASRSLQMFASQLTEQRQTIFAADSDWVAGQRELLDAKERSRGDTTQAKNAGRELSQDKQQLIHAQQVVAEARRVIAQGEVRLRQLGAKPLPQKTSSSSKQRQAK